MKCTECHIGIMVSISLTQTEKEIFETINLTTSYLAVLTPTKSPVVVRVAGGWVRDKVINII